MKVNFGVFWVLFRVVKATYTTIIVDNSQSSSYNSSTCENDMKCPDIQSAINQVREAFLLISCHPYFIS